MIKKISIICVGLIIVIFFIAAFAIFFDQAFFMRRGTLYAVNTKDKLVALTFDDGPSLRWTPQIVNALKQAGIKATFFMLGEHVRQYPDIARLVVSEGHEVGNHSYHHHLPLFYNRAELTNEIKETEQVIRNVTGVTTKYFRPPKAWLTKAQKKQIRALGYSIALWSLNSKDWVTFDDKFMVNYILKNIHPGDIILFHDSGGVFGVEGGDRHETVKTIPQLAEKLRGMGYRFVTLSELLDNKKETPR